MNDRAPASRPGIVTALAIIGIVEGILWMLCGGFGLLSNAASLAAGHSVFGPAANEPPAMTIVGAAESVLWLILSIVLICASVAALSLRPWARRVLMPWSAIAILYFIVQFTIQALWIGPHSIHVMQNVRGGHPAGAMARPLMVGFGVAMLIALCTLPICFLTLWRSEAVVAAFEPRQTRDFLP
ncbi:MAG TPA: hypothetical protein VH370_24185 [Humisphaera sp.]|jgi:hypothetical protein|nr:hypothetical protein [Humisphaera sp.]